MLTILSFIAQLQNIKKDDEEKQYIHLIIQKIGEEIQKLHKQNERIEAKVDQLLKEKEEVEPYATNQKARRRFENSSSQIPRK